MASAPETEDLKFTPLNDWHIAQGARMVPFAGYSMPVQYKDGIIAEHNWTREHAGLFDVSHMGQCFLIPKDGQLETAARALEALVPADVLALKPGQQRYSQFLNAEGGILDDLMITRLGYEGHHHWLYLVVNAACKDADLAHMQKHLSATCEVEPMFSRGLLALQGPQASAVLSRLVPQVSTMKFMAGAYVVIDGARCYVTRSGYTGGDGYEISTPADQTDAIARKLLSHPEVKPIGLGARDSLRLEAGLCLYGHDIDETTSPIEAGLAWSIARRRREQGGFPGAARIQRELKEGAPRRRVGMRPEGRVPAREGTEITDENGKPVGKVTSGGFGATAGGPIAMGYVAPEAAKAGARVNFIVRGEARPGAVVKMPFVPHRYAKG